MARRLTAYLLITALSGAVLAVAATVVDTPVAYAVAAFFLLVVVRQVLLRLLDIRSSPRGAETGVAGPGGASGVSGSSVGRPAAAEAFALAVAAGGRVARALVVEDHPINRELACRMLEKLSVRADRAANGEEAVRAVASTEYDLVFMDVQMPVLDGILATRRIRRIEEGTGRRVPIVAMTGGSLEEDRASCLDAGMDDFLPKPVRPRDIAAVVGRRLLGLE